jgi:hypothetical protein
MVCKYHICNISIKNHPEQKMTYLSYLQSNEMLQNYRFWPNNFKYLKRFLPEKDGEINVVAQSVQGDSSIHSDRVHLVPEGLTRGNSGVPFFEDVHDVGLSKERNHFFVVGGGDFWDQPLQQCRVAVQRPRRRNGCLITNVNIQH